MKKILGDIIILHMCTINENHMMYGSWDKECHRQNLFSFWTIFCSFTPLTTQKIKIKKKKQHLQISSFYTSVPWMTIIWSIVTEIWSMADIIFCHFQKFEKMKKTPRAIIILQKCTKNHDHSCTVSEIWYVTDVTVGFHFGLFFSLLFPSQPKISKF